MANVPGNWRNSVLRFGCIYAAVVLVASFTLPVPGHAQDSGSSAHADDCGKSELEYKPEEGLTQEERIARMDAAFVRSLNRFDECQNNDAVDEADESGSDASGDLAGAGTDGEQDGQSGGADASAEGEGRESASSSGGGSAASTDLSGTEGESDLSEAAGTSGGGLNASAANETPGSSDRSVASTDLSGEEAASPAGGGLKGPSGGTSSAARDLSGTDTPAPERAGTAGETTGETRQGSVALSNGKLPDDIPSADNDSVLEAQIRQAAIEETDPELKKKLWNEYRRYKGLPQVK